jgi:hypothetical protein
MEEREPNRYHTRCGKNLVSRRFTLRGGTAEETVLGDFYDASFTQFGVTIRLSKRDGRFEVRQGWTSDGRWRTLELGLC